MTAFLKPGVALPSLALFIFLVIPGIFAPFITSHDPRIGDLDRANLPPSFIGDHILGSDGLGRDILTRLIYGSRVMLYCTVPTIVISAGIAFILGSLALYGNRSLEGLIDWVIKLTQWTLIAVPLINILGILMMILMIAAASVINAYRRSTGHEPTRIWQDQIRPRRGNLVYLLQGLGVTCAIVLFYFGSASFGARWTVITVTIIMFLWPRYTRLIRDMLLFQRSPDQGQSAEDTAKGSYRQALGQFLRQLAPAIAADAALVIAILALAELGGVGFSPPTPSWPSMVYAAVRLSSSEPWQAIPPAIMIAITIASCLLLARRFKVPPRTLVSIREGEHEWRMQSERDAGTRPHVQQPSGHQPVEPTKELPTQSNVDDRPTDDGIPSVGQDDRTSTPTDLQTTPDPARSTAARQSSREAAQRIREQERNERARANDPPAEPPYAPHQTSPPNDGKPRSGRKTKIGVVIVVAAVIVVVAVIVVAVGIAFSFYQQIDHSGPTNNETEDSGTTLAAADIEATITVMVAAALTPPVAESPTGTFSAPTSTAAALTPPVAESPTETFPALTSDAVASFSEDPTFLIWTVGNSYELKVQVEDGSRVVAMSQPLDDPPLALNGDCQQHANSPVLTNGDILRVIPCRAGRANIMLIDPITRTIIKRYASIDIKP